MTIAIDEHNLFRIAPVKSSVPGDITNDAARAIIRRHAEHQHAKTDRLREARLAFEALQPPELPEAGASTRRSDKNNLPQAPSKEQSRGVLPTSDVGTSDR